MRIGKNTAEELLLNDIIEYLNGVNAQRECMRELAERLKECEKLGKALREKMEAIDEAADVYNIGDYMFADALFETAHTHSDPDDVLDAIGEGRMKAIKNVERVAAKIRKGMGEAPDDD